MQRPGLELYQCISELCFFGIVSVDTPFLSFSFFASSFSHSLFPFLFSLYYPRSLSLSFFRSSLHLLSFPFLILVSSLFPLSFSRCSISFPFHFPSSLLSLLYIILFSLSSSFFPSSYFLFNPFSSLFLISPTYIFLPSFLSHTSPNSYI